MIWQQRTRQASTALPTTSLPRFRGSGHRLEIGIALAETAETPGSARAGGGSVDRPHDLARIHDVVRVERLLDRAHQRHGLAMLLVEELDLAQADAVLAGAGPAHRQRAPHHP